MSNKSKLFLPGGAIRPGKVRARKPDGTAIVCAQGDCDREGDDRLYVLSPSRDQPGRKLRWIFCTPEHRQMFIDEATHRGRE